MRWFFVTAKAHTHIEAVAEKLGLCKGAHDDQVSLNGLRRGRVDKGRRRGQLLRRGIGETAAGLQPLIVGAVELDNILLGMHEGDGACGHQQSEAECCGTFPPPRQRGSGPRKRCRPRDTPAHAGCRHGHHDMESRAIGESAAGKWNQWLGSRMKETV